MKIEIPFTNYDIFGYMLPGSLFSLGLAVVFYDYILKYGNCIKEFFSKINVAETIGVSLAVAATLYFIGHIIGGVAHLFYDRIVVRYLFTYPFYSILDIEIKSGYKRGHRDGTLLFILASFALMLFPVINRIPAIVLGRVEKITGVKECSIVFVVVFLLLVGYLCLMINRNMSRDEEPTKRADPVEEDLWSEFCTKSVSFFKDSTATSSKVSADVKKAFFKKLEKRTGLTEASFGDYNSDIYWIANSYFIKNEKSVHSKKLNNWLDMFGCLRNYSCAFFLLAMLESARIWGNLFFKDVFDYPCHCVVLTLLFTLFSVLLFCRYWVMYYAYYSKYIIRMYALEEDPQVDSSEKT